MDKKLYRLYADESGHSHSDSQYLGITGCIIESEYYKNTLVPVIVKLKEKYFADTDPDSPVVLHRKELTKRIGPFKVLQNQDIEKKFNEEMLKTLGELEYIILSVVIDIEAHLKKYVHPIDPYHYCMLALLEEYCRYLRQNNALGDVLFESRGRREDMKLKDEYSKIYQYGAYYENADFFQSALTSKELKIKPKDSNIIGLQLADLIAVACKRELISTRTPTNIIKGFDKEIIGAIKGKYYFRGRTFIGGK